jgi:hypothetical protein
VGTRAPNITPSGGSGSTLRGLRLSHGSARRRSSTTTSAAIPGWSRPVCASIPVGGTTAIQGASGRYPDPHESLVRSAGPGSADIRGARRAPLVWLTPVPRRVPVAVPARRPAPTTAGRHTSPRTRQSHDPPPPLLPGPNQPLDIGMSCRGDTCQLSSRLIDALSIDLGRRR